MFLHSVLRFSLISLKVKVAEEGIERERERECKKRKARKQQEEVEEEEEEEELTVCKLGAW